MISLRFRYLRKRELHTFYTYHDEKDTLEEREIKRKEVERRIEGLIGPRELFGKEYLFGELRDLLIQKVQRVFPDEAVELTLEVGFEGETFTKTLMPIHRRSRFERLG
jgi:hypothetical protein